jgi:tetratricopeptide (TPR) repeat protein
MTVPRSSRNERCPCGSGLKYKRCCGLVPVASGATTRRQAARRAALLMADGQRLVQQSQSAAAIPLFEAAVRLSPDNAEAHYGLGVAWLACRLLPQAQASFHQATVLRPNYAPAHFNLALTLDLQGFAEPAIERYRAALAHAPTDAEARDKLAFAHDRLADLLLGAGREAEAAESHRAVIATSPGTTLARLSEARLFMIEQDWTAATAAARRAVDFHPTCGPALELLGAVSAITGDAAEALACFRQAVAVDPRYATAWLSLVSVRKITRDDAALIDQIEAVLRDQTLTDPERVTLHFALGKSMDDLGDYAAAMRHFDLANRLRGKGLRYDRQQLERHVDRTAATFTRCFFAGHIDLAATDQRPIFIMGMPRSGTTLVEQIVSSHPDVAAGGELSFWTDRATDWNAGEIDRLSAAGAAHIAADYSARLDKVSATATHVTDKMPLNFLWAGMIHALFPNAAILHCRRNPLDVCLSIYTTHFPRPMPFVAERRNLVHFYRQYLRLMEHWRAVLPANRFLDIDYEALVGDPEVVTRQMIAFCGLQWTDACLHPERNDRAVRTASVWQVRQPINRSGLERWRRYEPWLGELEALLPRE